MARRIILVTVSAFLILFGLVLCLRAQNIPVQEKDEESPAFVLKENIAQLREDLERTRQAQEKNYQELSAKLGQVLSNQERILKELDVIRVRVSRGR